MSENDTPPVDETADQSTIDGSSDSGESALGDKGKKALDEMKAKWHSARDRAKALEEKLAELESGSKSELDKLRDELRTEALRTHTMDKLELAASKKLANAEDARIYLGNRVDEFTKDGKVDAAAMNAALDELIAARPYLAAEPASKFGRGADAGPRNGGGDGQLDRAWVRRMAAEGKHSEIEKARVAGRLNDALSGKQ